MDNSKKNKWFAILTFVFIGIVIIDLFGEYLGNKQIVSVAKPLISIVLLFIYWINSCERDMLFIVTLLFGLLSTVLFIPNDMTIILWGVAAFAVHRLFLILFLLRILHTRDYVPIVIASLPVLIIFFYLLSITTNLNIITMILFSVNNILISFFCGTVISNYFMKMENKNPWLLISALMFVALQLIVYIEKFYLLEFSPRILRPTAVFFLAMALFTLVRGVLSQERLNRDASA